MSKQTTYHCDICKKKIKFPGMKNGVYSPNIAGINRPNHGVHFTDIRNEEPDLCHKCMCIQLANYLGIRPEHCV